ncbi:sigma-70 family RNA polymerase sigma factor [Actinocatenispora thailandica]|uniref:sigma-70 family RNA polymerase sigma factor n=1 Tax=Actinocatenispora thailandica TaxID=227318 RepID=UPI00194F0533|nr:sigma-70 family RNA polymerase sigma factor [Actinocatenispora thailandica]
MTVSETEQCAGDADGDGPTARVQALAQAAGGDRAAARAAVIESLLPLADRLARRYRGLGVPLEDLRQVAATGLIKSVDGYRPQLGRFVAYAVPTITGELRRYLRDRAWAVRPPRRLQELALRTHHAAEALCARLGRSPSVGELADSVGEPVEQVGHAMAAFRAYMAVSLDGATGAAEAPLVEQLPGADPGIDAVVDRLALAEALTTLPGREQAIIRMRFLDELTQQEIAEKLGISQAHVSGILSRTLRELRGLLSAEGAAPAVAPAQRRPSGQPVKPAGRACGAPGSRRAPRSAQPSYGRGPCRRGSTGRLR